MNIGRLHKQLGLILLIPLLLWGLTGIVFLIKPGYEQAYERLHPTVYPLQSIPVHPVRNDWLEIRVLRTVLGDHLLVRNPEGWQQLDPTTLAPRSAPDAVSLSRLFNDAVTINPQRYGSLTRTEGLTAWTDTGVEITLDWNSLSFQQSGPDTRLINTLYRIHYLQWFASPTANLVLGAAGIGLLIALTLLGTALYLRSRRQT